MNLEELQQLVVKGESEALEFKLSTGQRAEAAKSACALLNGSGGHILFGVTDKGEIVGQEVTAKTLAEVAVELRRIEPVETLELRSIELGNRKAVIVVEIHGMGGTYRYQGRPYIRQGPTTQMMPQGEYERRILMKFRSHYRWENENAPDWVSVDDLDQEEIQTTLREAVRLGRMNQPSDSSVESILRGLGLFNGKHLMNAAIVLYGKSERLLSVYPQLLIKLARFRGENRLTGFMDNRQYWGGAFELLRRAESFLLDHVPISGRVVPGKMVREDYPLYPPLATREALANAICHRDYWPLAGAVAMAMHNERLEIINPGELHFDLTVEELTRPHSSKPWNPTIAQVFYRAGIIETWGMGTLNIINWCKENGNPPPQWEVQSRSVIISFTPSSFFSTGIGPKDNQIVDESRPESIEDEVISLLAKGAFSKSEISNYIGHKTISGQLKKVLNKLLEEEIITYTIPEKVNSRLQKYKLKE